MPLASKDMRDKAIKLATSGMNTNEIAAMLGAKYNTVYSWLHPPEEQEERKEKSDRRVGCSGESGGA